MYDNAISYLKQFDGDEDEASEDLFDQDGFLSIYENMHKNLSEEEIDKFDEFMESDYHGDAGAGIRDLETDIWAEAAERLGMYDLAGELREEQITQAKEDEAAGRDRKGY